MVKKTISDRPHTCRYCSKSFAQEKTLFSHTCVKKMRWNDQEHKFNKLGFIAYKTFYEQQQKKKVKYGDLVDSKFYSAFIKFGKYVSQINCWDINGFIIFLIKTGTPLDKWTSDDIYETFLRQETFREPSTRAVERNILLMASWAKEKDELWTDFFSLVSPSTAVEYIRQGRLSPWILLTCHGSTKLLTDRLSPEQLGYAFRYIDLNIWNAKLQQPDHAVSIKDIQDVMKQAGFLI